MRNVVDDILKFNRGFHPPSLKVKIARLASSPFYFYRGTFHVFARDIEEGPFRKWPALKAGGQIVGDLHTENFGTYRSLAGEIVYDINDFDDTARSLYEYDVRRLATSLILSALDNKHSLAEGALAAEECIRSYVAALVKHAKLTTRQEFLDLKERHDVKQVLATAQEQVRSDLMKKVAVESQPGKFVFKNNEHYLPVPEKDRELARAALPRFLKSCLAPEHAQVERYTFQDVAFRIAGCGSLGRLRYAVLLGKGKPPETFETLRLIEWKDALDSSLEVSKPHQSKDRAKDILAATVQFQLMPKRYLGFTVFDGRPMQAREIGSNDTRFSAKEFTDPDRFRHAAGLFGEHTARTHLASTLGKKGPRAMIEDLAGSREDRWIRRMTAFAVAYTDRTLDDYEELCKAKDVIGKSWSAA